MKIRIVTDSASDLSPTLRDDLTVLPIIVRFGDEEYRAGVDISPLRFYEKMVECDTLPKTSLITPDVFTDTFAEAVENGDTVVAVVMSSKLSGTYQSAVIAAQDFEGKVFVVDSLSVSVGEKALVQLALNLKDKGFSAEEIAETLDKEKNNLNVVALVDTLEYLEKGGRISKTAAVIGGVLGIKPVITLSDGEVAVLGKARGSRNANNLLIENINKAGGIDFDKPLFLGYTGLSDSMLQKYIADSEPLWRGHDLSDKCGIIGATIGTYAGPGAVAVAFFGKQL
ncbi:MAG: DegV family protein [Oscillospiraceae bacterium]|nr:DegV family protein [Oscillospiraceae bacterium]